MSAEEAKRNLVCISLTGEGVPKETCLPFVTIILKHIDLTDEILISTSDGSKLGFYNLF